LLPYTTLLRSVEALAAGVHARVEAAGAGERAGLDRVRQQDRRPGAGHGQEHAPAPDALAEKGSEEGPGHGVRAAEVVDQPTVEPGALELALDGLELVHGAM